MTPLDDTTSAEIAEMNQRGFVVLERLLSDEYMARIRQALAPHLSSYGRNDFEGRLTKRVYALLARTTVLNDLILHPRIVAPLDRLLLPKYLITAAQAIQIEPDETPQAFHFDDQFTYLPRPRAPISYATIWAIDAFTPENGGTVVIPGSHLWGDLAPIDTAEKLPLAMPSGSVVFFPSTLWHGGGANVTTGPRLAVSIQYCQPYMRPQENQFLAVPLEMAKRHPPRLQEMMGYSIHPPFIGHADGLHPARILGTYDPSMRRERGVA